MTPNHYYLELYILVMLLLCPNQPYQSNGRQVSDGICGRLIAVTALLTFFYAGIQKLVHGYWHDGEFLAQSLFWVNDVSILYTMRVMLGAASWLFGLPLGELPYPVPRGIGPTEVAIPGWSMKMFMALSWFVIASELIIPPLVLLRRTRRLGLALMFPLMVALATLCWEAEFMFAALGCLLLFVPSHPWRNYGVLLGLHMSWSFFVIAADLRVPIL